MHRFANRAEQSLKSFETKRGCVLFSPQQDVCEAGLLLFVLGRIEVQK